MSTLATVELPAREREMLALYKQGLPYSKIAERFNYSWNSIQRLIKPYLTVEVIALHESNYRRKLLGRRKPVTETLSMRRLYLRGFTCAEIGKHYGIGERTVLQRIKPLLTEKQRLLARERQLRRRIERREARAARLRPRVCRLIEDGWTRAAIKQSLAIDKKTFAIIVSGISFGLRQQRASDKAQAAVVAKYSYDVKLAVLREAAELSGGCISRKRYRQLRLSHPYWPSLEAYLKIQPWSQWLVEAGIRLNEKQEKGRKPKFSEEQSGAATERVAAKLERVYSAVEYDECRLSTDPKAEWLKAHFGKGRWIVALEYLAPQLFERQAA